MYILDSIYGHIFLPQELKYIVNTKPFQRLRFIKQLNYNLVTDRLKA